MNGEMKKLNQRFKSVRENLIVLFATFSLFLTKKMIGDLEKSAFI